VNFKELTYDLAEVIYEYPFRLPSNFTYIMRALMTLEGIGVVTDPGLVSSKRRNRLRRSSCCGAKGACSAR
jgi:predicted unusual protein kinase regulating ubiquinone biosynthesis (AarF/ABC1/UbiB family)